MFLFASYARIIILYLVVIFAYRLMGKRQIGELQPIELGIAIMISDLATMPIIDKKAPLLDGIIPIFVLVVSEIIISYITLKNKKIRDVLSGRPSVVVCRGKIMKKEMEKNHFTLDELLEQLREASYPNISEVDYAIIETSGQMSVVPKPQHKGLSISDLKNGVDNTSSLPYTIISDGNVQKENIKMLGKDEKWLEKILSSKKISGPSEVFYMNYCENGDVFIQKYDEKEK